MKFAGPHGPTSRKAVLPSRGGGIASDSSSLRQPGCAARSVIAARTSAGGRAKVARTTATHGRRARPHSRSPHGMKRTWPPRLSPRLSWRKRRQRNEKRLESGPLSQVMKGKMSRVVSSPLRTLR